VDGRDAAPLAPSAGDVRITLHGGRLSVRADDVEVVSKKLAAP
jgi:hypothetical protein